MLIRRFGLCIFAFFVSQVALSEDRAATPAIKVGPCKPVMTACIAAGFTQGGHKEGKGIHADCVGKLFKGETVPGVSVPADQVKACQDRHQQMGGGAGHGAMPHPAPSAAPKSDGAPKK